MSNDEIPAGVAGTATLKRVAAAHILSGMGRIQSMVSKMAALFSLAGIYFSPVTGQTMAAVRRVIRQRFPNVPQITTADLAAWMADPNRSAPVIADVREAEEFAVSHLPGARNLNGVGAVKAALDYSARPVVVYCSVGYRSSAFAEKLRRAGIANVANLEGSIFQWANEGRPVVRSTERVNVVHPYNGKWGKMLDEKLRAPVRPRG